MSTGGSKLLWPLLTLALLLAVDWKLFSGFLTISTDTYGHFSGSLIDIAYHTAPAALAGLGMALVIATGGVDLSVGAVMAIAGAVAALLIQAGHTSMWLILSAALGVSLVCGLWNGVLVAVFRIQPIVATLLLMVAGRGIAQLLTNGQIINFKYEPFHFIGGGYFLRLRFSIWLVAAALILLTTLMRGTALGLFVEAVGDNETASRFAGINDRFVKLAVYIFSGFCAGVGGLLITSNLQAADTVNVGKDLELDAILAAVIGGTALTGGRFYLLGTIVGALIIQTLTTTILTKGVPVEYTLVVKAIVVLAVCLLQAPIVQKKLSAVWRRGLR